MQNKPKTPKQRNIRQRGFTLIELMVATVIFLIISGAAFALFAQHQPIFNQQQSLASVNIAMRNAAAQVQMDVVNGGANWYAGPNIPNPPAGVILTNNNVVAGGDCRTGSPLVYGPNCFDQLSIISADSTVPPTNPSTSSGGCLTSVITSSASTIYLAPAGSSTGYVSAALATAAATKYINGDQILLVKGDGTQYTTIQLTANASTGTIGGNSYVTLPSHTTTDAAGVNTSGSSGADPYDMTTHPSQPTTVLSQSFCSTDVVLRLTPIRYWVDIATDPANPTLKRTANGLTSTLTEQLVGFKVGATLYNKLSTTDTPTYSFDASNYSDGTNSVKYNYTLVRSIMVSLIGRTTPTTDPTYKFRNTFDQGAYDIQGLSVVVNPRNMSMAD